MQPLRLTCSYENGPYWIDQASNTLYQNKFSWNNISSE